MDSDAIRELLRRRAAELRKRAVTADRDLRHEADPLSADFAEQVTQRENDDVLGAISNSASAELEQVEAALRRLEQGLYGICVVCGEPIEAARLAAVPYAQRCSSCAETEETLAGR